MKRSPGTYQDRPVGRPECSISDIIHSADKNDTVLHINLSNRTSPVELYYRGSDASMVSARAGAHRFEPGATIGGESRA